MRLLVFAVSIHAPAWGATLFAGDIFFQPCAFQSTRPRGARRNRKIVSTLASLVSIHAPAWGATILTPYVELVGKVSIHAPAWGATVY